MTQVAAVLDTNVIQLPKAFQPYSRLDISNEDYHADKRFESSTGLKHILRSPAHYQYYKEDGQKEKEAYRVGTAIHAALLEHDRFKREYIISPDFNRRTKEGREEELAFKEQAKLDGKFIVSEDEIVMIERVAENVDKHKGASALLKAGIPEKSFYWEDPETGILCKSRTDSISPYAILDVKSCEDASPNAFMKNCAKFNYDLSAAMYREGVNAVENDYLDFAFLVVEKKAPYCVALYVAPPEMLTSGLVRFREALNKVKECRQQGEFPAYQPDGNYQMLEWPSWAYYRS